MEKLCVEVSYTAEGPKTNTPQKQARELLWACSGFPVTLRQHCHKPTPILSLKAQKTMDTPTELPTGIQTHPP